MTTATPPRSAEVILGLLLPPQDRQSVTGDLLEEYRETIHPARGRLRADLWYVGQVAGFVWGANGVYAFLLAGAFVARTAFDWLIPTADFQTRSTISTAVSGAVLVSAGFLACWRARSLAAGALAGVATAVIAAGISIGGVALLLAVRHDAQTFVAIEGSGGLSEAFTLPVLLVVPGAVLGTFGGMCGAMVRWIAGRA